MFCAVEEKADPAEVQGFGDTRQRAGPARRDTGFREVGKVPQGSGRKRFFCETIMLHTKYLLWGSPPSNKVFFGFYYEH